MGLCRELGGLVFQYYPCGGLPPSETPGCGFVPHMHDPLVWGLLPLDQHFTLGFVCKFDNHARRDVHGFEWVGVVHSVLSLVSEV